MSSNRVEGQVSPNDLDLATWGTLPEPDVTLEVPKPEPKPEPIEVPSVTLTKEDRLEAENLQLRITILEIKRDQYVEEVHNEMRRKFSDPISKLYEEMAKLKTQFSEKYGIDFKHEAIEPGTGNVIKA